MKKFLIKLVLFVSPFIIAQAIELFVLPVDFFTFRVWESLRITGPTLSMGKFYPNMKTVKTEVGTLARNTDYASPKKVTWITDEYGYRNRKSDQKPQIVIIGDSFTAGDTLSQEELLSEALERRLGKRVYSLAPANIRNYLRDPRFVDNPPDVVILQLVEGQLDCRSIRRPKDDLVKRPWLRLRQDLCHNKFISYVDTIQNRAFKWTMLEFVKARIGEMLYKSYSNSVRGRDFYDGRAFFFDPKFPQYDLSEDEMLRMVGILKEYERVLAERGTRFIFLPIPGKRTIYPDLVTDGLEHSYFGDTVAAVKQAGIQTVDLQTKFTQARRENKQLLLYQLDDSHWTSDAVEITADSVTSLIRNSLADSK